MGIHGLMSGVRRITGVLTGIQQVGKGSNRFRWDTAGRQGRGDVLLALVGHVHRELVGHEADEGAVQFLIEGRVEVLAQEVPGEFEPLERLTRRLPVAAAGDVGAAGRQFSQGQPYGRSSEEEQADKDPIGRFTHKEALVFAQRSLRLDETDVLAKVPYVLAVDSQGPGPILDRLVACRCTPLHRQVQRIRGGGGIPVSIHVIIGKTDRRKGEITGTAGNERILKGLGAAGTAPVRRRGSLDVIDFEVRREIQLGGLYQGDIALAGDCNDERRGIMRLQGVLAEFRAHAVFAHRSGETGGGAGRQGRDLDGDGRSGHPLALGHIVVLEEIVEDGTRPGALRPHIDQADDFGRVDGQGPRLLGYQHPAAQNGRIVHLVTHLLPLERDVLRSIHLLAPEPVE